MSSKFNRNVNVIWTWPFVTGTISALIRSLFAIGQHILKCTLVRQIRHPISTRIADPEFRTGCDEQQRMRNARTTAAGRQRGHAK